MLSNFSPLMSIVEIKNAIEKFAPRGNAAQWDNTGILVDSLEASASKTVLLTIDMTDAVVDECVDRGIAHIVAYHPVIFGGLKALCDRKLLRCVKHGIGVYCPHTQLDPLMNEYVQRMVGPQATLDGAVRTLKKCTGLQTFRVVRGGAATAGVVVGVGSAFKNVDFKDMLIITGEMSHHDMLRCKASGNSIVIMEHSNSERLFLPELRRLLMQDETLAGYRIEISESDRDPVEFA